MFQFALLFLHKILDFQARYIFATLAADRFFFCLSFFLFLKIELSEGDLRINSNPI